MEEKQENPSLRPNQRVQKLVLSTPARFYGEFDTPDLLVSQAWPPLHTGRQRWSRDAQDSLSRTTLILAIRTPPPPKPAPGVMIPNYEYAGDLIASALSVLFGKRFESHGPFEMSGYFNMPELSAFATPCNPHLRHNDWRPRADRPIPINLTEIGRIVGLLTGADDDPRRDVFHSAARFYRRAIATVEVDPESAYLNLITAGEIVANDHALSEEEALDDEARAVLVRIAEVVPDGVELARFLRGRLRGIKRRFVSAISAMVDDSFFDRTEAIDTFRAMQKQDFRKRIGAAYDLRSRFVHSGHPFGGWVFQDMSAAEVQLGRPVVPDREMAKALFLAPLFSGLERVIRYVLLTLAAELGADVEVAGEMPSA
jgi:hypothetical protein